MNKYSPVKSFPTQTCHTVGDLADFVSACSEIDKNLDQMANMRKDKIIMEGKLKK